MEAKVTWHQGLSFTGTADTGYLVPLGANPRVGGDDDGFRPMELIATGLAGCTGMDTISILQKKRQDVTDFEVKVHTERADEHPRVFTHIKIESATVQHRGCYRKSCRSISNTRFTKRGKMGIAS
jgi:putative redox protein